MSAVEQLQLRFPVAEIVAKTGFAKSTVSQYLNKDEPSRRFIELFAEKFEIPFLEIWNGIKLDELQKALEQGQPKDFMQGSFQKSTTVKDTGPGEPEPDYKAKYFALKAVVVELLRGNVSSSDVLEKLEADPASPGQSPAAYDDSAAGIERTYKGKTES